jgi:hypothetical protein
VDRAVALGWQADRVLVIDEGLGKSGSVRSPALAPEGQRVWSGWLNKAHCGELAFPLPSGYVRRPPGADRLRSGQAGAERDPPDLRAVRAARHVARLLRDLVENDIQLGIRLREGQTKGTLEW